MTHPRSEDPDSPRVVKMHKEEYTEIEFPVDEGNFGSDLAIYVRRDNDH